MEAGSYIRVGREMAMPERDSGIETFNGIKHTAVQNPSNITKNDNMTLPQQAETAGVSPAALHIEASVPTSLEKIKDATNELQILLKSHKHKLPDADHFVSNSYAVDSILASSQRPTLASNPQAYKTHTGDGVAAVWGFNGTLTDPLYIHKVDKKGIIADDIATANAPSMLTLMHVMSDQIAAQRESIAKLETKRAVPEAPPSDVRELAATVYNLREQVESQTQKIQQLEEDKSVQDQVNADLTAKLAAASEGHEQELQQLKATVEKLSDEFALFEDQDRGWGAESLRNLETEYEDQRCLITQLQYGQTLQDTTINELKTEIESLRNTNAGLEIKIETLSMDQDSMRSATSSQHDCDESLDSIIRPKPDNLDSSLAALTDRMDRAETAAKVKFSKTKHAVNHNAEVFRQLRSSFEEFAAKVNQEFETAVDETGEFRENQATTKDSVSGLQDSVGECLSSTKGLQTKFAAIMSDVEHLLRTTATKQSLEHLKNEQQSFAATSDSRLEKIEGELALQSEGIDDRIDNIWDDLNELHGHVDAEADEIAILREISETEQHVSNRFQESLTQLQQRAEATATKDSVTELESLHQNFSALSELRFEEIEGKLHAHSSSIHDTLDSVARDTNGLRENLDAALNNIESLQSRHDSHQKSMSGLQSCITKLSNRVGAVRSQVATVSSETEKFVDRFAPAQELEKLQEDFHKQQQWLDAFDKDVTDITAKSIPNVEKDIVDITEALESMNKAKAEDKAAFKDHKSNMESKLAVLDELKKDLNAARQAITEEKALSRIYADRQADVDKELEDSIANNYEALVSKIDSDIATLCFSNSLEPPTEDDFEVDATISPCAADEASLISDDDFAGDGLLDSYGNDTTTKKVHDLEHPYYTSYEAEDCRCDVCGDEHSPDCRGNYQESDDDTEDCDLDDIEGDEVLFEL